MPNASEIRSSASDRSITHSTPESSSLSERIKFFHGLEALKYRLALELPISKVELFGWLLFDFASSAFHLVIYPLLFPILVQHLATDEALRQNHSNTCDLNLDKNCYQRCNPAFNRICKLCMQEGGKPLELKNELLLKVWSLHLNPVSYFQVVWAIGLIVLMLSLYMLSPYVDYGTHQRKLMAMASYTGAAACILAMSLTQSNMSAYIVSAILFVVAMAGEGVAEVAYNRYLAVLIKASAETKMGEAETINQETQQWLRNRVSNRLSLAGTVAGTVGASVIAASMYGLATFIKDKTGYQTIRFTIAIGGAWWGLGASVACNLALSRMRQGPSFPLHSGCCGMRRRERNLELLAARGLMPYVLFVGMLGFLSSMASWGGIIASQLLASNYACLNAAHLMGLVFLFMVSCIIIAPVAHCLQYTLSLQNQSMVAISLLLMVPVLISFVIIPSSTYTFLHLALVATCLGISSGLLRSYTRILFLDVTPVGNEGSLLSFFTVFKHTGAWSASLLILTTTTPEHNSHHYRLLSICILSIITGTILFLNLLNNRQGLVFAGHVKAKDIDPDDCPVSSISTEDIPSSSLSRSPIDVVDFVHRISEGTLNSPPCSSSLPNLSCSTIANIATVKSSLDHDDRKSINLKYSQVDKVGTFHDTESGERTSLKEVMASYEDEKLSVMALVDQKTALQIQKGQEKLL